MYLMTTLEPVQPPKSLVLVRQQIVPVIGGTYAKEAHVVKGGGVE